MLELIEIFEILDDEQKERVRQVLTDKIIESVKNLPDDSIQELVLDSLKTTFEDFGFDGVAESLIDVISEILTKTLKERLG